jgi:arginase
MNVRALIFPLELGTGKSTTIPLGAEQIVSRLELGNPTLLAATPSAKGAASSGSRIRYQKELRDCLELAKHEIQAKQCNALLGGDCSSDFAMCAAQLEQQQELAVVWIDAHADLNTPESSPSGHLHGMVLRALLGDSVPELAALNPKPLCSSRLIFAGLRETDPEEARYIQAHRIPVLTVEALTANPKALADGVTALGFRRVHVHLDLDVLCPKEFSSTGFPSPCGLSVAALTQMLRFLHQVTSVNSIALTEYAPTESRDDWGVVESVWRALSNT